MKKSYLKECKQYMKHLRHISMAKFWKQYIYHDTCVCDKVPYHGLLMNKLPCDMFIYPDIFYHNKPETVIEIGTARGGSAVWFSDLLDNNGGHVITIDVNKPDGEILELFDERDIVFIQGDATTMGVQEQVMKYTGDRVIVIDDGSHKTSDIWRSFKLFQGLISDGGFYIVEDGMSALLFKDRPLTLPNNAINYILDRYPSFKLFTEYDKFVFTSLLRGILRKKTEGVSKLKVKGN